MLASAARFDEAATDVIKSHTSEWRLLYRVLFDLRLLFACHYCRSVPLQQLQPGAQILPLWLTVA